jgi:uncharacterized protein (TIRG00374 family)
MLLWGMRDHFTGIGATLGKTNRALFFAAILLFVCNVGFLALRLHLLFTGEGLRFSFGKIVQLSFVSYFFNNFMPTAVGGDVVKVYYAARETREGAKSFVSVFMDRFIGLSTYVFIATVMLFILWNDIDIAIKRIVLMCALFGIIAYIVILNARVARFVLAVLSRFKLWNVGQRLSKIYRTVHGYRSKKRIIAAAVAVSLVIQFCYFCVIYLLGTSLDAGLFFGSVCLLMPIVTIASMVPSLGGLGAREGAIVALFGTVIGNDNAFAISLLLLTNLLTVGLIGAGIYACASQFKIGRIDVRRLDDYGANL